MSLSVIVITNKKNLNKTFISQLKFGKELIIYSEELNLSNSFAQKRNNAIQKAKGDWILFVDDDEIVSRELATEILEAIKSDKYSGYYLKRKDTFFNEVIKNGEVGNIQILRLAKKDAGNFIRDVHEVWKIKGKINSLSNPLYHIKDGFLSEFISRISLYGPLDANSLDAEKKYFSYFKLLFYPKAKFILNYFFKKGFLDGYIGLFFAYLMSIQSLSVRIFQWEKQN